MGSDDQTPKHDTHKYTVLKKNTTKRIQRKHLRRRVCVGMCVPLHNCHTRSSANSAVVCRSDTSSTTSCAPECPSHPPSYKGERGNRPLYPHLPPLPKSQYNKCHLHMTVGFTCLLVNVDKITRIPRGKMPGSMNVAIQKLASVKRKTTAL